MNIPVKELQIILLNKNFLLKSKTVIDENDKYLETLVKI